MFGVLTVVSLIYAYIPWPLFRAKEPALQPVNMSAPSTANSVTPSPKKSSPTSISNLSISPAVVTRTEVYVNKGDTVIITATGRINSLPNAKDYDGTYKWVGPEGWGNLDPGFISEGTRSLAGPLPQGRSYLALTARIGKNQPSLVDGNWIYIGRRQSFVADQDGYLYFVVNEKLEENGHSRMEYLSNNQGSIVVDITVKPPK